MKSFITISFSVLLLAFFGCSDETPYSTNADQMELAKDRDNNDGGDNTGSDDQEGPKGDCPNINYESTKTLNDGITVTWTSSFGGFDYKKGTPYTVTVTWETMGASATFVGFVKRHMVWTPPKYVNEDNEEIEKWSTDNLTDSTIDLTVTMVSMHRAIDPDWQGYIGNGHFTLVLDVDGITVKLGVNVHLEDPDEGVNHRCPGE